jgi:solute carrier family 4 anion exchanger 2
MIRNRKRHKIAEKLKAKKSLSTEEKKLLSSNDEKLHSISNDPFQPTFRLWGGMINDIKRRFPMYASDIRDGLNTETFAATLFLYFAGLATAITFGALIGEKTSSLIGTSETLLSSFLVGCIFHALASQPLVFVGTTGPLILFDESLYQFCTSMSVNFLTFRVYIGIWLTIIVLIVSAFEGSIFVKYFTRFTQEIFSALITLIYIVETILTVVKNFEQHPLGIGSNQNETRLNDVEAKNQPNTALFSMLLTIGTFSLAYGLKIFRNSKFLGRNTRRALGDFVSNIDKKKYIFKIF